MKRILAWAGIFFFAALFLALIFFTVTGAPANVIKALLFTLSACTIMVYAFVMCVRYLSFKKEEDKDESDH